MHRVLHLRNTRNHRLIELLHDRGEFNGIAPQGFSQRESPSQQTQERVEQIRFSRASPIGQTPESPRHVIETGQGQSGDALGVA